MLEDKKQIQIEKEQNEAYLELIEEVKVLKASLSTTQLENTSLREHIDNLTTHLNEPWWSRCTTRTGRNATATHTDSPSCN